jgi:hypothetical protein
MAGKILDQLYKAEVPNKIKQQFPMVSLELSIPNNCSSCSPLVIGQT